MRLAAVPPHRAFLLEHSVKFRTEKVVMLLVIPLPPELPAAEVQREAVIVRPVGDGQRVKENRRRRGTQDQAELLLP